MACLACFTPPHPAPPTSGPFFYHWECSRDIDLPPTTLLVVERAGGGAPHPHKHLLLGFHAVHNQLAHPVTGCSRCFFSKQVKGPLNTITSFNPATTVEVSGGREGGGPPHPPTHPPPTHPPTRA